jgi:hypothetical protein
VVADPHAPDRFAACQLLAAIAVGDEATFIIERLDPRKMRSDVQRQASMNTQELAREAARWAASAATSEERRAREMNNSLTSPTTALEQARWATEAYDAVKSGVPTFVSALSDASPAVRLWLVATMTNPDERAPVVAAACVAAGLLGPDTNGALLSAAVRLVGSDHREVHWAACIAVCRLDPEPDPTVVSQLYECLLEADDPPANWPYLDGDARALVAFTARDLGRTSDIAIETLLHRVLTPAGTDDRLLLLRALLDATFGEGARPDPVSLTEPQRSVLDVLVRERIPDIIGAMAWMTMARYGLPTDTIGLRNWTH